ncbi:hypothetical protein LY78DRAFT_656384 [Colletotrichum sublineola]|nr:hypothetical protein LY78DRAFT_656384 [Colletotrichum sublineola]
MLSAAADHHKKRSKLRDPTSALPYVTSPFLSLSLTLILSLSLSLTPTHTLVLTSPEQARYLRIPCPTPYVTAYRLPTPSSGFPSSTTR